MTYDAENRQISVSNTNPGMQATYYYDGDGKRVMRYINGQRTMFVYDSAGQLAAEYDGTPPVFPVCATCYLSSDQLGSTRLVTNQNINVVERHDYLPFGEEIQANQAGRTSAWGVNDLITQKFTGKERDSESGLDYFGARYYGSALGRFSSPDDGSDQHPEDPQSWNLYGYVRNNPLINTDPTGRACSISKDSNGNTVITDVDGKGCSQLRDNTVRLDRDELNLLMLQTIGENLTSPEGWTSVARGGMNAVMAAEGAKGLAEGAMGLLDLYRGGISAAKLAELVGTLRQAAKGKGNFGLGTGTAEEAEELGKAWVGEGAKTASDGKTLVSADGLRTYRPPSYKPNLEKVQANFEQKLTPGGRPYSNGHLDIK
jgi:RHS repeat-associated protein